MYKEHKRLPIWVFYSIASCISTYFTITIKYLRQIIFLKGFIVAQGPEGARSKGHMK